MQLIISRCSLLALCFLFFIHASSIAQPGIRPVKKERPDTICFPYESGLRMIMVDHEGRRQQEVDWHEAFQPRALTWNSLIPPSPLNEYVFLDSSGNLVKSFNTQQVDPSVLRRVFTGYQCGPPKIPNPKDWNISRTFVRPNSYAGLHTVKYGENPAPGLYRVSSQSGKNGKGRIHNIDHIGLINAAGQKVLPMSYSYIEVAGAYYLVVKNHAYGLIRSNLEETVPIRYRKAEKPRPNLFVFSDEKGPVCSYDVVSGEKKDLRMFDWIDNESLRRNENENWPIVAYRKGDQLGFVDRSLTKVTEPVYDYVMGYFRDGLAPLCREGKWGFINGTGKEVIPCEYEDAVPFDSGMAKVRLHGELYCIDTKGKLSGMGNCHTYYVIEEKPAWRDERLDGSSIRFVKRNQMYGGLDQSGRLVIPFIYEGVACITKRGDVRKCRSDLFKVKKWGRWGVIRPDGSSLLPCIYDEIREYAGYWQVMQKTEDAYDRQKVGLLNDDFAWVFPCEYESLQPNLIPGKFVFRQNGSWGMMDKNGTVILPPTYQEIGWMKNGLAPVKRNGYYGMIDSLGREQIPVRYEAIGTGFVHNRLPVKMNHKWGYIDSLSNLVIPCSYDAAYAFDKPVAPVRKGNVAGFINLNGEPTGAFSYDQIGYQWLPDGLIAVSRNNKTGFADESGKLVIPCIYDEVSGYNREGHRVKKDGKWMMIKRP